MKVLMRSLYPCPPQLYLLGVERTAQVPYWFATSRYAPRDMKSKDENTRMAPPRASQQPPSKQPPSISTPQSSLIYLSPPSFPPHIYSYQQSTSHTFTAHTSQVRRSAPHNYQRLARGSPMPGPEHPLPLPQLPLSQRPRTTKATHYLGASTRRHATVKFETVVSCFQMG